MDGLHIQQIILQPRVEQLLKSFETPEFLNNRKTPEQVNNILAELQGLPTTLDYGSPLNKALFALARKSQHHGNLEHELIIAQKLVEAGAIIPFTQKVLVSCNQPSQIGQVLATKEESTLAIARGDLKEFLNEAWRKACSDVEWAEDTDLRVSGKLSDH